MKRKALAVSKLADYAADPEGFVKRRGGVRSKSAARAGARHHYALGKPPSIGWWLLLLALLFLLVLVIAGPLL